MKQTKIKEYWLNAPVPIMNRYEVLENTDDSTTPDGTNRSIKPSPIFVDGVGNIQPLMKLLDDCVNNDYVLKVLREGQVKVQPKTTETYVTIVKELRQKETEFHTYKPKQDRTFRVVLKNMHHTTNTEGIKNKIEKMEHKVTNVWNIKQRTSKMPLPMFFVELKAKTNNKDIYNVATLLNCRVQFELPRPKREIPQCAKCQRYGHTKRFCYRQARCVKCAGEHLTINCSRKNRSDNVKCGGYHPANYKGCTVHKQLQRNKFPPLRNRKRETSEAIPIKPRISTSVDIYDIVSTL